MKTGGSNSSRRCRRCARCAEGRKRDECGIAADMAIVARSLAQEAIKLPQAGAIMARIYDVSDSARDEADERHSRRRLRQRNDSSQKFAEDLFTTCMKEGGNMDTVLGKRL